MPINNISIIGHRGARSYAPENVIPGYEVALESGVDSIDVDVVTTSDKVLLAYHDLHINSDILSSSNDSFNNEKQRTNMSMIVIKRLNLFIFCYIDCR